MDFLQEFQRLLLSKPRYNLIRNGAENCEFAEAVRSKNCYYCFGIFYSEDIYYARYSRKCTSCSGLTFCIGCEWCTECIDCSNCYMADFCQDCANCRECQFCKDCFGCSNCFGCVGLYQKQYRIFNEQLTKEEYEKRMQSIDLKSADQRDAIRERVQELRTKAPNMGVHQFSCEDCIGNHLSECKNCYRCHDSFALEDCLFCIETNGHKVCCDLSHCFECEWSYQCVHCPNCQNCNFCFHAHYCSESEFCVFSKNLKNCFGCVYMQNKEFHILNKPYAPEDYKKEVERIRSELQQSGHYNLLPYFCSPYEDYRIHNESDSAIQAMSPISSLAEL